MFAAQDSVINQRINFNLTTWLNLFVTVLKTEAVCNSSWPYKIVKNDILVVNVCEVKHDSAESIKFEVRKSLQILEIHLYYLPKLTVSITDSKYKAPLQYYPT